MPDRLHLLVDARPVDHPTARQRGIGRYVTGLLAGLSEIGASCDALVASQQQADTLRDAVPGIPIAWWSPDVVRHHAQPGTWYVATQLMLHPIDLDPIPSVVTDARLPVAAVMYDVIPRRYPERYLNNPFARRLDEVRTHLARTVDMMLAISRFSAETAIDALGFPSERMVVIGAGVEPWFCPSPTPGPRPGHVVAVTGGDPRKNTEGLIRAWSAVPAAVRQGRQLVIVAALAPSVREMWQRVATEVGLVVGDDVVFTGGVSDEQLVTWLQTAELSVMPSIEEGFGLPVVEAAACGVPVICSRVSSLPEVLDLDEATFDPHDTGSIAVAITRALTDDDHRDRLRQAGRRAVQRWQWSEVARATIDVLSGATTHCGAIPRPPAARLAVMTPPVASPSAIGRYTDRVLTAFESQSPWQVERLVDTSGTPMAGSSPSGGRGWSVRALGHGVAVSQFDHVVAVLGSSPHHVATAQVTAELLDAGVGVHLWLHEASLVGVFVGLAHQSGSTDWARRLIQERLVASEPPERVASVGDVLDAEHLHRLGVTLIADLAARAASIIVSTNAAADLVRRSLGDMGAPVPPLLVLPHAFPPVTSTSRQVPVGHDVVSLGWLAPNKAPEVVIAAFAAVEALPDDARLIFAGPVHGDTGDMVQRIAADLGVRDRVVITGNLTGRDYDDLLARPRVGVQWRVDHRGEQSGAVSDLVAAGVPTITNLPGAGTVDRLDMLGALLTDDEQWRHVSRQALDAAQAWTVDHVARALTSWLKSTPGTGHSR